MKKRFKVASEGDCEALAKVFIQWLKDDNPKLRQKQVVEAPNEAWASLFSEIYADEIDNNDLAVKAERNMIQVEFNVLERKFNVKLSDLSQEDLLDLLQEYLDSGNVDQLPDDGFTFGGDDSDDEDDDDDA